MNVRRAINEINKAGVLLVFPIANKKEPASLWSRFFPRSKMRWEWDASGDTRVSDLWALRAELTARRDIAYAKWFQGRATFFSLDAYSALLSAACASQRSLHLSREARDLLEILDMDSPLSPRQLRKAADLTGRDNEKYYSRGLKELWANFQIVGCGEIDDGSFPSLALGSTRLIYEDLWEKAKRTSLDQGWKNLDHLLSSDSVFYRYAKRTLTQLENSEPRLSVSSN